MTTELLARIIRWFHLQAYPTQRRAYYQCPICYGTWFQGQPAKHERLCWIPELWRAACGLPYDPEEPQL